MNKNAKTKPPAKTTPAKPTSSVKQPKTTKPTSSVKQTKPAKGSEYAR